MLKIPLGHSILPFAHPILAFVLINWIPLTEDSEDEICVSSYIQRRFH